MLKVAAKKNIAMIAVEMPRNLFMENMARYLSAY
jgi:hypothetical protein